MFGKTVKSAGGFLNRRAGWIVGGAAAAGVASSHPLRTPMAAYQQDRFDDPQYYRKAIRAQATVAFRDAIATPAQMKQIDYVKGSTNSAKNRPMELYGGRTTAPVADGSMVMGLYNGRFGGR